MKRKVWSYIAQTMGWCQTMRPVKQPETRRQCRGENLVLTTMSPWHSLVPTSNSLTGPCLGTQVDSSEQFGENASRRTPKPKGEQMRRPSDEKHSSLMKPLPTLGSSMKCDSLHMFLWILWFLGTLTLVVGRVLAEGGGLVPKITRVLEDDVLGWASSFAGAASSWLPDGWDLRYL